MYPYVLLPIQTTFGELDFDVTALANSFNMKFYVLSD